MCPCLSDIAPPLPGRLHFEDLQVLSWLPGATRQRGWELGGKGDAKPALLEVSPVEVGEGRVGVTPGDLDLRALKLEACLECRFLGLTQKTP